MPKYPSIADLEVALREVLHARGLDPDDYKGLFESHTLEYWWRANFTAEHIAYVTIPPTPQTVGARA